MESASTLAPDDLGLLLQAAADFASYPGMHNEIMVKEFLDRFPLPKLFAALQHKGDVPGLEDTLAACLDKVFGSRYGASFLPHCGAFMQAGLQANSETIRCLACKAVCHLLEKAEDSAAAVEIVAQHEIYPLLLNCLTEGGDQISTASLDAIKCLAQSPKGMLMIFPKDGQGSTRLKDLAACSSSLGRVHILALIAKLFSISSTLATAIYDANLLNMFENEINDRTDVLQSLTALELLYELVESPHSSSFLLKTTLLQLVIGLINDSLVDSLVRSRAALISGRLLSSAEVYNEIDDSCVTSLLSTINSRLELQENQNTDEFESELEALGLIGATTQGAHLLLTSSSNVGKHVVESAFDRQSRGKQLAALHALGSICGVDRPEDKMILDNKAEECLKQLVYTTAANSPKLTPSGLLLSVLQQEPEKRTAGYRMITGLVVRRWCLMEVCSKPEIISFITDPTIEADKTGMEARYECCISITRALSTSRLLHQSSVAEILEKLQDAVRRGPYLAKKHVEAQPVVVAERR